MFTYNLSNNGASPNATLDEIIRALIGLVKSTGAKIGCFLISTLKKIGVKLGLEALITRFNSWLASGRFTAKSDAAVQPIETDEAAHSDDDGFVNVDLTECSAPVMHVESTSRQELALYRCKVVVSPALALMASVHASDPTLKKHYQTQVVHHGLQQLRRATRNFAVSRYNQ